MRAEIPEGVIFEKLEDTMVVLELSSGRYYSLNPSGARVWELLETLGDTDLVKERMEAEFPDVDAEKIRQDVDSVLEDLKERQLVVLHEP